ncbi:MAG: recombination mediator RecR [bacterium]|nr:recombination mediator RecR [bacterium]
MQQSLSIQHLLDELEKLPGIGPKSAQRVAYYLLNSSAEEANRLADAIRTVKERVTFCECCFNYAEADLCDICASDRRDESMICVVCEPRDITAIERTNEFQGLYHVLGGSISPLQGITPADLHISELLSRLADGKVVEVIIATNPDVEGEATAIYLSRLIKPLGIKVTRLASGLPVGGELEYADEITLGRALEARREL